MTTPILSPRFLATDPPSILLADHPIEQVRALLSGESQSHGLGFVNLLHLAMATPTGAGTPLVHDRQIVEAGRTAMTLGGFIASIGGGGQPAPLPQGPTMPPLGSDWTSGLPPAGRPWADEIRAAAAEASVDPRLLAALVWAESGFKPEAVSSSGAVGLTQLMPATAAGLGVDPTDPIANLEGGARFLRAMLDQFGSDQLALAAYNAGPTRVAAAGGIPDIASVPIYVGRVLEYAGSLGYGAPVIPSGEVTTTEANVPVTGAAAPANPAGTKNSQPVGTEVVEGYDVELGLVGVTASGSVSVRGDGNFSVLPPMTGTLQRLAQAVEELRSGPPPRRMSVDFPELGGIRISVTLLDDGIRLNVPRTGGESERLVRDLATALRERGFDLSGEGEPRQPHDDRPPAWPRHHEAQARRPPMEKTPGWLL